MNILVIKQTSLGDVLHSTGHVRALKKQYPDCRLVLMTATSSADIYRHSPDVDEMILFDRYWIKQQLWRQPVKCWQHLRAVVKQVRAEQFDLAIDLQGLARTVIFLYLSHARKKFVKGNWPGLSGFRNKRLHAIGEMDEVLAVAGVDAADTGMVLATSAGDEQAVDTLLQEINPDQRPLVVLSPFSRWQSKDWPLERFAEAARLLSTRCQLVVTGASDRQEDIEQLVEEAGVDKMVSLAGKLSLLEFAALVKRARVMLTGDSFPMHVASACHTDVVALFGPTDESRVGPVGDTATVIRAPDCRQCDRRDCSRGCLGRIPARQAVDAVLSRL